MVEISGHAWTLPLCYHTMATVHRKARSKYWYAAFRIPVPSPDGVKKWRQVKKVTK